MLERSPKLRWESVGRDVTDKHGKIMFNLPSDHVLSPGLYPIKFLVKSVSQTHTTHTVHWGFMHRKGACPLFPQNNFFLCSPSDRLFTSPPPPKNIQIFSIMLNIEEDVLRSLCHFIQLVHSTIIPWHLELQANRHISLLPPPQTRNLIILFL